MRRVGGVSLVGGVSMVGLLILVACGGTEEADAGILDGGARDGAVVDGGTSDAGASDGGTASDGGATMDAALDGGGPTDGGMRADASATRITLSEVAVYANCMPIVPADPILAFWDVTIADAPTSTVQLTSAKLTITGTTTFTQNLTVDLPLITLTGGGATTSQRKTGADANPSGACGSFCSGATFSLELTYDVGGSPIVVMETGAFSCVY